jgi:hypothetical protein
MKKWINDSILKLFIPHPSALIPYFVSLVVNAFLHSPAFDARLEKPRVKNRTTRRTRRAAE